MRAWIKALPKKLEGKSDDTWERELTEIGDLLDERSEEKGGVEDDGDNSGLGAHVHGGSIC